MVFLMELCGQLNLHLLSEQKNTQTRQTKQEWACRDSKTTEVSKGKNLVIKVWVLRVVKNCRAGSCGENWTSRLSVDTL